MDQMSHTDESWVFWTSDVDWYIGTKTPYTVEFVVKLDFAEFVFVGVLKKHHQTRRSVCLTTHGNRFYGFMIKGTILGAVGEGDT
jgi:hypothetical protein